MSTLVRSYSKINLGLAIGPPRPDGFHGLTTLYQTLELHDLVTVEAARAAVKLYKFKPAMENGKPVTVEMNVEVTFHIF